jgi:hypothetical protein
MGCALESSVKTSGSAPATVVPEALRLDEVEESSIIPANLRALEAVYSAAMLDEARVFEVVDRLVAMFSQGSLPLGPGRAGAMLYRHWKGHPARLTTTQRQTVYARAFGWPGGEAGVKLNHKFNDFWMRFVAIVGMYAAELMTVPPAERTVTPEDVLVSGRLLAINLSAHGQGLAWFATQDLKPEIQQIIELLSDAEIQKALEARDPWQVVAKVAGSELGARPNVARGRTRGESGTIIIRWLANRRARLLRPRSADILRHEDICEGRTAASQNKKATVYPTDSDLVTACEQWLAVTGTEEAQLKMEATPVEQAPAEPVLVQQEDQEEALA